MPIRHINGEVRAASAHGNNCPVGTPVGPEATQSSKVIWHGSILLSSHWTPVVIYWLTQFSRSTTSGSRVVKHSFSSLPDDSTTETTGQRYLSPLLRLLAGRLSTTYPTGQHTRSGIHVEERGHLWSRGTSTEHSKRSVDGLMCEASDCTTFGIRVPCCCSRWVSRQQRCSAFCVIGRFL
jgi:hypothetical protein